MKGGERNRTLTVVKSRGTKHSSQVRELLLGEEGVSLADVYTAGGEVLVGTARFERELADREAERKIALDARRRRARIEAAEAEVSARIAALQRELDTHRLELEADEGDERERQKRRATHVASVLKRRVGDSDGKSSGATEGAPSEADER